MFTSAEGISPKQETKKVNKMFAIKLTNVFQDAYNQQHTDGLLSESAVDGEEWSNPEETKTFNTKEEAESAIENLHFKDAPDLEAVEI